MKILYIHKQHYYYLFGQRLVRELAILRGQALQPGVIEFTWEIVMHVEALVPLGATLHQVELAQLHFTRR